MNDYGKGVIETLGWFLGMLEEKGRGPRNLKAEVEEALKDVVQSASQDFRQRIIR